MPFMSYGTTLKNIKTSIHENKSGKLEEIQVSSVKLPAPPKLLEIISCSSKQVAKILDIHV